MHEPAKIGSGVESVRSQTSLCIPSRHKLKQSNRIIGYMGERVNRVRSTSVLSAAHHEARYAGASSSPEYLIEEGA